MGSCSRDFYLRESSRLAFRVFPQRMCMVVSSKCPGAPLTWDHIKLNFQVPVFRSMAYKFRPDSQGGFAKTRPQGRDTFLFCSTQSHRACFSSSPCVMGDFLDRPLRDLALCVGAPTLFRTQRFSLIFFYMCNLKGQMPAPELTNSD